MFGLRLGLGFVARTPAGSSAAAPQLRLSSATIPDTTESGGTVGTLSVANGSGIYTYSLISNPADLFSVTSDLLKTAAALTAGSYPITVEADNGVDPPISRAFLITVTESTKGSFSSAFSTAFEVAATETANYEGSFSNAFNAAFELAA